MKEEKDVSKNKWRQLYRKKWFFPALYLTIAALLLTVVVWYQNSNNQVSEPVEEQDANENIQDEYVPVNQNEDAQPVLDQEEVIKMPIQNEDQAEIVTKIYDYNASDEEQEMGLVHVNNGYQQSKGIDITNVDGSPFDVVATLSGTVTEVKEDPLLGKVVTLSHPNNVVTYYSSLGEIEVETGAQVDQGDILGTAGTSLYGKDHGTHVHFELRVGGERVNPETYFNQPVSKVMESMQVEADEEEDSDDEDVSEEDGVENEQEEDDEEEYDDSSVPSNE